MKYKDTLGWHILELNRRQILKFASYVIIAILIIMLAINNIKLSIDNAEFKSLLANANNRIDILINEKISLEDANSELENENLTLSGELSIAEDTMQQLQEKLDACNKSVQIEATKKDFKSYIPYTAITDKSSKQWELQQIATTNNDGIRCLDGIPMVAVGTGWGVRVGDTILIVCENGNSFIAIVGDIKANRHTDSSNKTTLDNGCRCEFIVDLDKLDPTLRKLGTLASIPEYQGYVVSVVKVVGEVE